MNNITPYQYMGLMADDLPPILLHEAVVHTPDWDAVFAPKPKEKPDDGPKECAVCNSVFQRRKGETPTNYRARKACSQSCSAILKNGKRLDQDMIQAIQAMARTSQYTIREIAGALSVSISAARKYSNAIGYWGKTRNGDPVWTRGH